jgi:hypothetical protein
MWEDEPDHESFEQRLRQMAEEIGRSVERVRQLDVDEIANAVGVEPEILREWADFAGGWLRQRVSADAPQPAPAADDPLRSAGPHPLDLPSDDQGLALAALSSGRWTVEPGSGALSAHGEGPGPSDAIDLARELRARDWMTAEGKLTEVGRHALARWLDAAGRS